MTYLEEFIEWLKENEVKVEVPSEEDGEPNKYIAAMMEFLSAEYDSVNVSEYNKQYLYVIVNVLRDLANEIEEIL